MILGSAVDTWATVAVAIGTIGAVAYALFRDLVVMPRRRPKLELLSDSGGHETVRLRVANAKGKDTADDVVVIVTEVSRAQDVSTPIVLPLTWSGSVPPMTVASVHPGSERHLDLLRVDGAQPRLALTPKPAAGQDLLAAGTCEISLEVRARNADAIRFAVPVSWDGRSVRVEPPRQIR